MKISEIKNCLNEVSELNFKQVNGETVPVHFHITEMGVSTKHFIDCGGKIRSEKYASIQIWVAQDIEHRLTPGKLLRIIELSDKLLGDDDLEIEVEYQTETIGKYALSFKDGTFILNPKHTDCLAKDTCGVDGSKQNVEVIEKASVGESCCTPGGTCC